MTDNPSAPNPIVQALTGQTEIAIGVERGQVILRFPAPVSWAALDPENARQIGEAIARAAYESRYGVKPQEGKSRIGQELVDRLTTRVSIVLRSLAEQGKSNGHIARAVVDVVLSEVA